MSTWDWLIVVTIILLIAPIWWHGDVDKPLSGLDMILSHTRWGHPKSPYKVEGI